MFRSYSLKPLDYGYEITIVDDDFTESAFAMNVPSVTALINIYSRRNLNVSGNLALLIRYGEYKHSWDIKRQIKWFQAYVPEYQKYHDQVIDYLIFL